MSLLLALMSVTATCTPDPALADAGPRRLRDYIAAINTRDEVAIGRFLAPNATFSMPNVDPMPLAEVMTQTVGTPEAERLEVVEATARGDTVVLRTRTPSGATASAAVRLDGGCIRQFTQD